MPLLLSTTKHSMELMHVTDERASRGQYFFRLLQFVGVEQVYINYASNF
jgi:hypothetical protein